MARVKVLHAITNLTVGGATDNTLMTVAGHSRDRYEVHLVAGGIAPEENYTEWRDRARDCADDLFILPEMRRSPHPVRDLMALRTLTRLMTKERYDIVHTHCSKAGLLGRIAARRASVPVVVHTYHAFAWQVTLVEAQSPLRRGMSRVARAAYLGLEKYAASLADVLITVSDLNRKMAIDLRLAPAHKVVTIRSGIDLHRRARSEGTEIHGQLSLASDRPVVGTVGRLAPQKDPLTFVEAAKHVLKQKPDVQFIMIGDGPLEGEVREAIGGESRIRMLGYRDDVSDILGIMDAFVLSSRWEGLGRALTEAVGFAVPVAATAVDGIPELITHGETGRLSDPGDAGALAKNIGWILDNAEEARCMASRAAKRVCEEWGASKMVSDIERLYSRLLVERKVIEPAGDAVPAHRELP